MCVEEILVSHVPAHFISRAAVTPTSLPFGSGAARLVYPQDLSVIRQVTIY